MVSVFIFLLVRKVMGCLVAPSHQWAMYLVLPELHSICAVTIHIAGAAKVGTVDHAKAIPRELEPLLERENTILQVVSAEECDCIIGVYRLKGRLVCDDAMRVFGEHFSSLQSSAHDSSRVKSSTHADLTIVSKNNLPKIVLHAFQSTTA